MAEYVNMQQSEYDDAVVKIAQIHNDVSDFAESIDSGIIKLTDQSGGFYIEKISEKVQLLLRALEQQPVSKAINIFEKEEETVKKYMELVKELDKTEGNI